MKALHKDQSKKITSLINTMEVARIMYEKASSENDFGEWVHWRTEWAQAVIALGEIGIELPNLDLARQTVSAA